MIIAHKSSALLDDNFDLVAKRQDSIVLQGISWQAYRLLRWETPNDHLRMTYAAGRLEIMSPKKKHGKVITAIGVMILEWARYRQIPIEPGADMTCEREDLEKGVEPDLCYWIAHEADVRGKDEIDLLIDPPPDLVLEVDVTRSSIPKLPIYAALRIPEVWRWSKGIEVLHLNAEGEYAISTQSIELPGFPLELANRFIERRSSLGHLDWVERFAAAIRTSKAQ